MASKKKPVLTSKPITVEIALQQRQEELELINKKLAQSQADLEAAYRQYADLYDFAPVGYLTLARNGAIHQVNLAGANLLGLSHNGATGVRLSAFISSESRSAFKVFFEKLLSGEGKETCELALGKKGKELLWVRLEATCFEGSDVCRAMLTDITEHKRMDQVLQESEWRTRIVSELTTDYIFVVDVDPSGILNLSWASDNLYRMTGHTIQDAATSDLWGSIIHPDDRSRFFDFIKQILSTAKAGELECRTFYKLGGERWVWIFARPQVDERNKVTTIVGAIQDITERKQANEQLQESEKRFRNLVETTSDWIWEIDTNGFYTYASPRIRDILGFESSEIIGKKPEDFMPPEEAQRVLGIITPIFASRSQFSNLENKNFHKDGRVIFLETSGVPIVDNDGVFCGYRGIDRDITERKQAQEALKKSEAHYHDLVETSQDLIWQCDSEGRYTYLNPAWEQVFGYKTQEMLGKKFADFQTPQIAARDQKEFARLMRGNAIKGFETCHIGRLGNEIHLVFNAKSIYDENGKVIGTHGTAYDITERKKAEQALKESESLYRKMNENSPLGMHFYKLNDKNQLIFTGANPAADKLLGTDNSQFIGKTIEEAFPALIQTEVPERYRDTAEKGIPWSTEQIAYDDKQITGAFDVRAFQTTPGNMVAIFSDITERKQAEVELQHTKEGLEAANRELQTALALQQQLAHTDSLTGINNRRNLYELAEHEFDIAIRYRQPLSVIMFDIDHFKQVNDTFGHTVGDQILQRVTQVARAELRSADVIGRYGGEEFVVILPMTNAKKAYPLAERIRMGVAAMRLPTEKGDAAVTLSIGIVEMAHEGQTESIEVMIRYADEAMYTAKQAGRNRTEIGNL